MFEVVCSKSGVKQDFHIRGFFHAVMTLSQFSEKIVDEIKAVTFGGEVGVGA